MASKLIPLPSQAVISKAFLEIRIALGHTEENARIESIKALQQKPDAGPCRKYPSSVFDHSDTDLRRYRNR